MSTPKPLPPTPETRARMQRQRTRDTKPELELRRELHRLGLRYRVHQRPLPGLRREADVVFRRAKVAVFVDSCFWHRCPRHYRPPNWNAVWWEHKTLRTAERDRDTVRRLRQAGWKAVRVWEHERPPVAAARVASVVRARL